MSKKLTNNQKQVIEELHKQGCHFVAAETEKQWEAGNSYYLDARLDVKGIRRKFEQGNKEAKK